jgi:hypothetical protein
VLPPLTPAQRRHLVAKYNLNISSPTALLVDITRHIAAQPLIDPGLARLLAVVAAIKEPEYDIEPND